MRPIFVFGPSGSGKSTLISSAISKGCRSIDLEWPCYSKDTATTCVLSPSVYMLIGAANLPLDLADGMKVVLLPPKDVCERRALGRGRPSTYIQRFTWDEWRTIVESGAADLVMRGNDAPGEVLAKVLAAAQSMADPNKRKVVPTTKERTYYEYITANARRGRR